jgi:hypothetical protein
VTHITANTVQVGFQGRDDDVALNSGTFTHNPDTDWSQDADVVFRVRFAVEENAGGDATASGQLEANLNGGAFQNVTTGSSIVKAVTSSQFTDGAATSDLGIGGAGNFVAGSGSHTGDTADVALISQHTELEYAVQIVSADVANGNTIVLRIAGLNSYTIAGPTLTVTGVVLNASVEPVTVAATASIPTPTVTVPVPAGAWGSSSTTWGDADESWTGASVGGGTATPATVQAAVSIGSPAVRELSEWSEVASATTLAETSGDATATPARVLAAVLVPAVTIKVGVTVSATTVAASSSIGAPTVEAGGAANVTPATVAAVASVGTPTVTVGGSATVTPATVSATATVPSVTVFASSTLMPSTAAGTTTIPSVTISAGSTAIPATTTATASVPTPGVSVSGSATVTPATVQAVTAVGAPTVSGGTAPLIDITIIVGPTRARELVAVQATRARELATTGATRSRAQADADDTRSRAQADAGTTRSRAQVAVDEPTRHSVDVGETRHGIDVGPTRERDT